MQIKKLLTRYLLDTGLCDLVASDVHHDYMTRGSFPPQFMLLILCHYNYTRVFLGYNWLNSGRMDGDGSPFPGFSYFGLLLMQ